jgi:hypothetical protein
MDSNSTNVSDLRLKSTVWLGYCFKIGAKSSARCLSKISQIAFCLLWVRQYLLVSCVGQIETSLLFSYRLQFRPHMENARFLKKKWKFLFLNNLNIYDYISLNYYIAIYIVNIFIIKTVFINCPNTKIHFTLK